MRPHIGQFGPSDNVSDFYCLLSDMKAVMQCLKVKINSENGHVRDMTNLILVEIDLMKKKKNLHLQLVKHFTHKWRQAGKNIRHLNLRWWEPSELTIRLLEGNSFSF